MMNNDIKFPLMGLLVNETSKTIEARSKCSSWPETIELIIDENILQKTRSLSSKRYISEIQMRAAYAYDWELETMAGDFDYQVKSLISYLICMKTYNLLTEFFDEFILPKYHLKELGIEDYELRSFIEKKQEEYPRLRELTDSTLSRLKSYLIKIFKEAGLIMGVKNKQISVVEVPAALIELYKSNGKEAELRYIML